MNDMFLVQVCQATKDATRNFPKNSFIRTSSARDNHLVYSLKTPTFAVFHCYRRSLPLHHESPIEFDDKR